MSIAPFRENSPLCSAVGTEHSLNKAEHSPNKADTTRAILEVAREAIEEGSSLNFSPSSTDILKEEAVLVENTNDINTDPTHVSYSEESAKTADTIANSGQVLRGAMAKTDVAAKTVLPSLDKSWLSNFAWWPFASKAATTFQSSKTDTDVTANIVSEEGTLEKLDSSQEVSGVEDSTNSDPTSKDSTPPKGEPTQSFFQRFVGSITSFFGAIYRSISSFFFRPKSS